MTMPRAGEAIDIELRTAVGRHYNPDRYEESLRRVITECPDESERKAAEKRLHDFRLRTYQKDAEAVDALSLPRKDPLHSFSRRHRQTGNELRWYAQGEAIGQSTAMNFSEAVDHKATNGLEGLTDRRRTGYYAKMRAIDAITTRKRGNPVDYRRAVWACILGRKSLSQGAWMIGLASNTRGIKELKRAMEQALDAAADYLGVKVGA